MWNVFSAVVEHVRWVLPENSARIAGEPGAWDAGRGYCVRMYIVQILVYTVRIQVQRYMKYIPDQNQ